MTSEIPTARARLIERIVAAAHQSGHAHGHGTGRGHGRRRRLTTLEADFLRAYYHGVAEEDLAARDPRNLAAAALDHLDFGRVRPRGRTLVKLFSPSLDRDGFTSPHTLVLVVATDMPFLVDSLGIVLQQTAVGVHLIVHPVLTVERDRLGTLRRVALAGTGTADARHTRTGTAGRAESWQLIEIDRQLDTERLHALERHLRSTLDDVRAAVEDWPAMRKRARALATELLGSATARREARQAHDRRETHGARVVRGARSTRETREAAALLEWMDGGHFTFLGYRSYRLRRGPRRDLLVPERRSGLGILRVPRAGAPPPSPTPLTGELRKRARTPHRLILTKANSVATVHRAAVLDYVGIKSLDARGRVSGEHRFIGLWTSSVYEMSPSEIPVLRQKVAEVLRHFALAPGSHDAKAVQHTIETFPRDELFQATVPELSHIVRGIVNLYERSLVRLLLRRDAFDRFYSCFVFMPRDRYSAAAVRRIESILETGLGGGETETQAQLSESTLARLHIVVRTDPAARPARSARRRIDVAGLERAITNATATWADRLRVELATQMDEAAALAAARRFLDMLPATYLDDVEPRAALADVTEITALERDPAEPRVRLLGKPERLHLKVLKVGEPVPVSDILPMMENFGLRLIAERPYELAWAAGGAAWIQDFELEHRGARFDLERVEPLFREGFLAVWRGEVENDGFNRLLLGAGLAAREIAVLRAYCRYLLQAGIPFSQRYMERVLASNAGIARGLFRLFALGPDPRLTARIRRALDAVMSLDEDRILRAYLNAVAATLRTNFHQRRPDGRPKPYLAFKLDPQRLPELPLPRPKFEVFVYSPRVEAVHLRMANVARGGIRWSDRREDFRTEILGLMKAQNVKNTVIVPMGAKGGFVVKRPPAGGPAELQREVIACYRTFMQGLLDLTDNIVGEKIVHPPEVACLDGPDPYLVVAADKGTAAFSDIANGISADYRFWLGDAFASGGSAGYDHKKMGITARGAWECVKRHFRELGTDIQRTDFSVVGIGDMSGDVFGNGMLLSRHILLEAAFNHQHIFLDPTPDARVALAERARLFALPRSTWDDYDRRRISRGGGVFARSAKSIPLSREIQSLLALSTPTATPEQVIRAILEMPVDLLWNGGIGTYVKASTESNLDVGDRANDAVRVNGSAVRAKVVGEGGNLGLSQRGRVEYALKGGRLNTDFIDNSAGVNTSDVEVNIKILLNPEVAAGRLRHADRDGLLARMTPEVAALVLRNNYLQGQALSMLESQSVARLAEYRHLIRLLERSASLDRALEFLPDDDELEARRQRGVGLTRPEQIAVVLAYSRIWLSHHLLASDVPEDPYLKHELERYFPPPLRRRFAAAIRRHRLRREIIVTATANSLVNRMGPAFVLRAAEDTGAEPARIARAYTAAREIFDARTLWAAVEALDGRLDASIQYAMMIETSRLLRHASYRLLATRRDLSIERAVADLRGGVRQLKAHIAGSLRGLWRERFEAARRNYIAAGVPADLAARIASLDALNSAPDIVEIAGPRESVRDVARVYFEIGVRVGIDWLHDRVERLPVEGAWQAVARTELRHGVERAHRRIAERVLSTSRGKGPAASVAAWLEGAREKLGDLERRLADMRAGSAADFATLSVALESVRALCD